MDLFRLENFTKRFPSGTAVDIPELTITKGEFFTFVGPSGCGKSTTLNMIAGLEPPSSGHLWLGDRLLDDLPPHKRDMAFVFQSYALYPHRTVAQNLAFPLEMARRPPKEIRQRVQQTASSLGLTALLDKYPRQLSGGERQRVALGRAMVREPALFLFDEPLSNLDAPLRALMRKELKRLHQRLSTTFIYVTHDQEEALSLADRIAVMNSGHIEQCGPPDEIYLRPANLFVAAFFGSPSMNFFSVEMVETASGLKMRLLRSQLRGDQRTAPEPKAAEGAVSVVVGIRPEDLKISHAPVEGAWPARITLAELHGGQTNLEAETGCLTISVVAPTQQSFRAGELVWLTISRFHTFHAYTGKRINVSSAKSVTWVLPTAP